MTVPFSPEPFVWSCGSPEPDMITNILYKKVTQTTGKGRDSQDQISHLYEITAKGEYCINTEASETQLQGSHKIFLRKWLLINFKSMVCKRCYNDMEGLLQMLD